jgi:VWFA-related protein
VIEFKPLDYMATTLEAKRRAMVRGKAIVAALGVWSVLGSNRLTSLTQAPLATFRSNVDLVRISAVVRDRKGRFVQDLSARDFEIMDAGQAQTITDFHPDVAPVSLALLFDVSGSMLAHLANAREAAMHVLSWLDAARDETAIYTFDTRLDEVSPFTVGLTRLPESMSKVVPFGATSLRDAIARTAQRAAAREGRHRAVVAFTDGLDNASRLTPAQVAELASSIDVPIYIVGIVASIDNPSADIATSSVDRSALAGALVDVAAGTGGQVFIVSSPAQRSVAARQIVDELRHQYLIAFESSGKPGWHPLVVRTLKKDLVVRARTGYIAGQSRPNSW